MFVTPCGVFNPHFPSPNLNPGGELKGKTFIPCCCANLESGSPSISESTVTSQFKFF
jgi:hypothetical protein